MSRDHTAGRLDRPVFVVGAPRSGTTMLQAALDRHPGLAIHPETHFLTRWVPEHPGLLAGDPDAFEEFWRRYAASRFFSWSGLDPDETHRRLTAGGIPDARAVFAGLLEAYLRRHDASRVGEKTPDHLGHLDRLLSWFPDARIVWMLRDPRGVAASLLDFDQEWATNDPEEACHGWLHAATELERWIEHPQVCVVRYEEVTADPGTTLRGVVEFVELEWDEAVVAGGRQDEGFRHGTYDPWGPVRGGSVDRWRQRLSGDEVAVVEHVTRPLMTRLGYEPVSAGLSIPTRLRLIGQRGRRRAARWWGQRSRKR